MDKWTTQPPTKTGYYWAYENLDPEDADVIMIYIGSNTPRGYCVISGNKETFPLSHFCRFSERIYKPVPPERDLQK